MRAVAVAALACGATALSEEYVRANAPAMFADFVRDYGRKYDGAEHARREAIFTDNMVRAAQLEAEEPRASFGMNKFSDLSADEFKVYHTGFVKSSAPVNSTKPLYSAEEVSRARAEGKDWRKHGAVTGVKDQKQCGSCWAFSAVCAAEGAWFLAGNTLTSLSEQELVSCGPGDGCGGGDMHQALNWVKSHGGLNTEKAYPYSSGGGSTGRCDSSKEKAVASISSVHSIGGGESNILATMTKEGPLSIGVDAGKFQSYRSGVLSSCSGRSLDHGVAIVGYQASHDAWIVKNSWGSSWGESGYIRLAYGSNQCGMSKEVTQAHEKKA